MFEISLLATFAAAFSGDVRTLKKMLEDGFQVGVFVNLPCL